MPGPTLPELLARAAARGPGAEALIVHGVGTLSYGAWERRSNAQARGLLDRGVKPGGRVALLFAADRWIDQAVTTLATFKVGAVAVHPGAHLHAGELGRTLRHSEASAVVCGSGLLPGQEPSLLSCPEVLEAGRSTDALRAPVPASPIAELFYESGPLRAPNAVSRSYQSLRDLPAALELSEPGSRCLHAFLLGTEAGQTCLLLPLVRPCRVETVGGFDPEQFRRLIADRRPDLVGVVSYQAGLLSTPEPGGEPDAAPVPRLVVDGPVSPEAALGLQRRFATSPLPLEAATAGAQPVTPPAEGDDAMTPITDEVPLSVAQEGFLWQEQFAPGCFSLSPLVRRLRGVLDVPALERALTQLVTRQEALRLTFAQPGDHPVQSVNPPRPFPLPVVDVDAEELTEAQARAVAAIQEWAATPFDLVASPPFRARLVRLEPEDHLLAVQAHHLVWDDWSVGVFLRELEARYAEAGAGGGGPPPPTTTYSGFARRQRRLSAGTQADELSYWSQELAGAPWSVQLRLGDPALPPGAPQPAAASRTLRLSPELSRAVRALARQGRVTPFMAMMAAFSVLVGRYTGQDDIVLSTVTANRSSASLEGLIGCFAQKIPVRVRMDGDPTFSELLRRVRTSVLGAMSHSGLPFEVVMQHALGRQAADHGLVPQVGLMFQGMAHLDRALALPGLDTSIFDLPVRRRHFLSREHEETDAPPVADVWGRGLYLNTFLGISLQERGERLVCVSRGVYHEPAVEVLLDRFEALLADLVRSPARPVSDLDGAGLEAQPPRPLDLRGFGVDLGVVEAALAAMPAIEEVALTLQETDGSSARLVAVVAASDDVRHTLGGLRAHLWQVLPGYAWPAAIAYVPALPRTSGGDIDREALGRCAVEADDDSGGPGAPEAGVERLLSACWAEARGLERVSVHESYRQSFTFVQALVRARQAGVHIGVREATRSPNLRVLAAAHGATRPHAAAR